MKSFEDAKSRIWVLNITVSALRRIKAITGIDLGNITTLADGSLAEKLGSDPVALAELLYAAIQPDIPLDDFCDAIFGDTIEKASFALFEALADFFPSRQGDILRKILLLAKEQQEKAAQQTETINVGARDGGVPWIIQRLEER